MFDMAEKCANAEEGRRLLGRDAPEPQEEASKSKAKDVKPNALAGLTAKPDKKHERHDNEAEEGSKPYYLLHKTNSHNTKECRDLKHLRGALNEKRLNRSGHAGGSRGNNCDLWGDNNGFNNNNNSNNNR